MPIALMGAYIIVDLLGIVFFTLAINYVWQYSERSRIKTITVGCCAILLSCLVSFIVVHSMPESIYSPILNDKQGDYDIYLFYASLHGLFNGLALLFVPHFILRVKHFFSTVLLQITLLFGIEGFFSIIATAFHLDTDNVNKVLVECIFEIVAYTLLSVLIIFCLRKTSIFLFWNVIDTIPKWIYLMVVVFSYTVYCKSGLFDGGISHKLAEQIYDFLWIISTIGIVACGIFFFYKLFCLSYQQNQIMKQMSIQQTNFEQMIKSDEQLREFRHDYKNHMMVVTALLNSGRNEEAADYLEKVKISSGLVGRQFSTGNFIVDAILNNKNSFAEEFGIHLSFSGQVPEKGIENSDLCIVFANLLDNAIEGTKRYQGNRYINIESNIRNGMLTLSLINPVNEKIIIKKNRISSTKHDVKNHGIGLRNVERVAEKYHGSLLLSCNENEFSADISLKLYLSEV